MMTKEYRNARNNARKAQEEVKDNLQKFAKRSKHIIYDGADTFYGFCRIDVIVNKDGKVVREMMEYLKSICPFYNINESSSAWFHNYDDTIIRYADEEDEWEVQFEICVSYR